MILDGGTLSGTRRLATEVCVIGSGAGGMAAASLLAQQGRSVVLLEEGNHFTPRDYPGYPLEMMRKLYRGGSLTVALGRPMIPLPLGKCVGGTTVINSGTCLRMRPETLAGYRERYGWRVTPAEMDECYGEVERVLGVQVPDAARVGENARLLRQGAEKLGIAGGYLPRNAMSCEAHGGCCFGCPTQAKQSVDVSFLPPALRAGLTLVTGCRAVAIRKGWRSRYHVLGLTSAGQKTTGHLRVAADRVVVACGSVHTPGLLSRSGLGRVFPGLGGRLTIHPAVKLFALFPRVVRSWEGVPQSFYTHALVSEGISIESITLPPDIGISALSFVGRRYREVMDRYAFMGCCGLMLQERGFGQVHSLPLYREPLVTYGLGRGDAARIQKGMALIARIFLAAGALEVYPGIPYLPVLRNESEVERFEGLRIRDQDLEMYGFHPLGTCRMAGPRRKGLVDEEMQLRDAPGVYVADASIFPKPLGVNPQLSIMAMAAWMAKRWP
ncbi:MAG: GMC family oxidoreductase [Planctomycetota bacterium]